MDRTQERADVLAKRDTYLQAHEEQQQALEAVRPGVRGMVNASMESGFIPDPDPAPAAPPSAPARPRPTAPGPVPRVNAPAVGTQQTFTPPPQEEEGVSWSDVGKHGLGAIADTLGFGRKGARTTAGVILDPKTTGEKWASAAALSLPIARTGALVGTAGRGLSGVAGRLAAEGALGGAKGAYQGEGAARGAALGVLAGAVPEVGLGVASKLAQGGRSVYDAWRRARAGVPPAPPTEAASKVIADIDRGLTRPLSSIRIHVPSLGGMTTVMDAARRMDELSGAAYTRTRNEIFRGLENYRNSFWASMPWTVFSDLARFTPAFKEAKGAMQSNSLNAMLGSAANMDPEATITQGLQTGQDLIPGFLRTATNLIPRP